MSLLVIRRLKFATKTVDERMRETERQRQRDRDRETETERPYEVRQPTG